MRSMRARRAALALGAALATATSFVACQTPTSVLVAVSTDVVCEDLEVKSEAHVVVARPDEIVGAFDASSTKTCEQQGAIGEVVLLPASSDVDQVAFRVVLGVGRETSDCGVVDTGLPEGVWAGCIVARRRIAFLDGEALTVDVPLYERCIGVPCEEGVGDNPFTTCNAKGECVPADLDPEDCLDGCGEEDLPGTVTNAATSTGAGDGGGGDGGSAPTPSSSTSAGGDGGAPVGSSTGGGEGGEGGGEPSCNFGDACALAGGEAGYCDTRSECVRCLVAGHCGDDETCIDGGCFPLACSDGLLDPTNGETDVDCGGDLCAQCAEGQSCAVSEPGGSGDMPDDASCASWVCFLSDGYRCAPCTDDGDCLEHGRYCDTETWECELPRQLGAPCETDVWCASERCVFDPGIDEGVCCESACAGPCLACHGALTGQPDGQCEPGPAGVSCGPTTCESPEMLLELRCNNAGSCSPDPTECEDGSVCLDDACVFEQGTTGSGGGGSGAGGDDQGSTSSTAGSGGAGGDGGAGPVSSSSAGGMGGSGGDGGAGGTSASSSAGGGFGGSGGDGGGTSITSSSGGGDGGAGFAGGGP